MAKDQSAHTLKMLWQGSDAICTTKILDTTLIHEILRVF